MRSAGRAGNATFALLVLAFVSQVHSLSPAVASVEARRQAMNAVFQSFWEDALEHAPEFASSIGDKRFNDKIADRSVKAFHEGLAREHAFYERLAAIDTAGFTEQEKISRDLLMRDIAWDEESEQFREWELPVNQLNGIYADYPQLVEQLSFTTAKDYDDWIARLHAIPTAFNQVTTNMSLGIQDHRMPPRYLLEKALAQVNELANQKAEDSPLAMPLKKFPAIVSARDQERIKREMLAAISNEVLPAYVRFAHFMETTYIPAAPREPGLWTMPDGPTYYQFLLRRTTTTNLSADAIHQIGVEEVSKDEAEMLAIAQKLGFKDLVSFRASVKTNPTLKFASAEAMLEAFRGYLKPMQARLPGLFGRLPKAPFEVVPVPEYLEKNAPTAAYQAGTPDGSRPGRLRINTYKASERMLLTAEADAYHEGLPGHHMQISIAQELQGFPEFRKYEGYTSFDEGWALYAERLGKDIGYYQDPYSDYGRLENDIWRAIRLVVDTGVHSQHWTRDQMVQYFHDHSSVDETAVQTEVDRYIAWPSQAVAYKIGQLRILELRDLAKKELGDKFDIRAFHDQVIDNGSLPLDVLEKHINAWIASQK